MKTKDSESISEFVEFNLSLKDPFSELETYCHCTLRFGMAEIEVDDVVYEVALKKVRLQISVDGYELTHREFDVDIPASGNQTHRHAHRNVELLPNNIWKVTKPPNTEFLNGTLLREEGDCLCILVNENSSKTDAKGVYGNVVATRQDIFVKRKILDDVDMLGRVISSTKPTNKNAVISVLLSDAMSMAARGYIEHGKRDLVIAIAHHFADDAPVQTE